MKIEISWEVNVSEGTHSIPLNELVYEDKSLTEEVWGNISNELKLELVQNWLNEHPDQPFKMVDSIN